MMSGTYSPVALFGPTSSIGRKQYLVSFGYQLLAAACAAQIQDTAQRATGISAAALGMLAFLVGIGAFALMLLAIRARLSDCGMSLGWLTVPVAFLVLDIARSITHLPASLGEGSITLLSFSGFFFVSKISVVALLLLLALTPSSPGRRAKIGSAP